jgi:hypothetical protein
MDANQLAAIKAALSRMDEAYWMGVVERNGTLSSQLSQLWDDFQTAYIKLVVSQFNILDARYNGYSRLLDAAEGESLSAIVEENKDAIAGLMQEKYQLSVALSHMLTELGSIVAEVQTLGEVVNKP